MSITAKVTLGLLLAFAALLIIGAVPDWSDPNDLNANTAAANVGRFGALFYILPVVLAFALGIVVTRGRYRTAVMYLLSAVVAIVAAYILYAVLAIFFFYHH